LVLIRHTKQLKTNNGRKRTNINGAINLATKEVFYVEDERINSQTMINLLEVMLAGKKKEKYTLSWITPGIIIQLL
jgi:hypothetical protein